MKKSLFILLSILFSLGLTSAYSYSNFDFSPSNIMENEWFVFAGVFLVVFALVYIALANFFRKKTRGSYWGSEESFIDNKPAVGVISFIIAFFSAAAFVQKGLLQGIFGEAITSWVLLLSLIVVIIITIPFYKALKKNVGGFFAILIFIACVWFVLTFVINLSMLEDLPFSFGVSDSFSEVYEVITNPVTLVIFLIIAGSFALLKKRH